MTQPSLTEVNVTTLPSSRRRKPRGVLGQALLTAAFVLIALIFVVPIAILVITSIRSEADFLSRGVFAIPKELSLANFAKAWDVGAFATTYKNSALITLVKVPLGLLVASLAAFALAKLRLPFRNGLFIFFVAGLTVPIHIALLPLFVLGRDMHTLGSLWGLIPPYIAFGLPFQVFVLRGFINLLPGELVEAARVDGATDGVLFFRVILPLLTPVLATLGIIDAVATWNEFLMALVLLPDPLAKTLPLGLQNFFGQFSGSYTQLSAGIVIAVLPLLVLYIFLQRYLVSGLAGGAVKG